MANYQKLSFQGEGYRSLGFFLACLWAAGNLAAAPAAGQSVATYDLTVDQFLDPSQSRKLGSRFRHDPRPPFFASWRWNAQQQFDDVGNRRALQPRHDLYARDWLG